MRSFINANRKELIAFGVAFLLYMLIVIIWSLVLRIPEDGTTLLAVQKDLIYYSAWALSGLFAVLGTAVTLRSTGVSKRQRRQQFRLSVAAVALPMAVGLVLEIANTIVILPNLPGDLHPAMQLVISGIMIGISVFFALRGAMLPGQIVIRNYIRFGLALMFIPTLAFIAHMPLTSDWSGPVRGIALGNAMLHGILWGVLYAGILGANLLHQPTVAKPAGRH